MQVSSPGIDLNCLKITMDFSRFTSGKTSKCRKKLIPWHCQRRYQESISEISMNLSVSSALYRRKIRSLQKNNKVLALALQHHRSMMTEKEDLMVENGKSIDIINFSRLKLMDMVEQMKKASACLEETLQMLNLRISDNLSKHTHNNVNYRGNFKGKLQEINIEPIEEVSEKISENTDSSDEQETLHKSNNSKRNCSVKRKGKHAAKTSKIQDKTIMIGTMDCKFSILSPPNGNVKNSKKCAPIVQCKKKRIPLEETSCESIYNSNLSPEISSIHSNTKYISNKSDKNEASVVSNEISQAFSDQKNINQTFEYNEQITFNPNNKQWKNFTNLQKASKRETIEPAKSNKVVSKRKYNSTKRKRALKTITELTNCNNEISEKDNSFVVTAEIHPIPDDICEEKSNNKKIDISSLQPCVLLTDILKSNKTSSFETVNKSLLENDYLKKAICVESETEMDAKENDPNVIYLHSKMGKKKLPMESLGKKLRRRAKILNYKEPALSTKMRRC
ncbi:shugoshin_C domain-containing protein [Trichonephila clavata]|uniref:Shugoshin_C domain-containing protein n=1 Tax=Trichonephila clavata TaxID=2740835 RepID=A0A8X6LZT6_TRICU|nr:shugoshin_C domain-containing protein [Trichonephila clavata]